jgi:predicted ATPase
MTAAEAREIPGRTKLQALADRFAETTGLVVLDNCEHVLAAARAIVEALRAAAPEIRILVTSREALGLRGERILPMSALPVRDATRLFAERALAVRPDLDIDANRETIARLCARLDGIPLAIELAAARCRSMSPTEIDRRLDDRFRLLRGGRSGTERHRTLQAAVAWSYSLLDSEERHVFDRMAVFAGGTFLDGLSAVAERDELDALDALDRLIARSMVSATDTPLGTRYCQLETLRQYAEERLVETGQIVETRDRHLCWIADLATKLNAAHGLTAEAEAIARFGADRDNFRVAITLALQSSRKALALEIVAAVSDIAWARGDWDVIDLVRPIDLDQHPGTAAIGCELRGAMIDIHRGSKASISPLRSRADLPAWYEAASTRQKTFFQLLQLQSGGDHGVVRDLLDACEPATEAERLYVNHLRLYLAWADQSTQRFAAAEIDSLHALGVETLAMARRHGGARRLALAYQSFSYAMTAERPTEASALAKEGAAIFERLGADYLRDATRRAIVAAQFSKGASSTALHDAREDIAGFVSKRQFLMASTFALVALAAIARDAPETCLRFWAVRRRVHGTDRRRDLEAAGLSLPADVDALMRETADITLSDALKDVLAAFDRVIAASGTTGAA